MSEWKKEMQNLSRKINIYERILKIKGGRKIKKDREGGRKRKKEVEGEKEWEIMEEKERKKDREEGRKNKQER